jgi:hypothetical protein
MRLDDCLIEGDSTSEAPFGPSRLPPAAAGCRKIPLDQAVVMSISAVGELRACLTEPLYFCLIKRE